MVTPNDLRPDPDSLLARVKLQETRARRGTLRIYFGSSAGVGKTFAMLLAARKLKSEGMDVLVGVVETHGRAETAVLLEGLEILPLKTVSHRDRAFTDFDLDRALKRHPTLMLVDELAHSNAPGARHPKRWQDVEELLAAGIDVFTTLNVQHLESLNDVVGAITNVRVWETVPDTVFDAADEVVLVDIPAEELLARLKSGKVYIAHQAERAADNFFRKGNLMALRELALRRTADRVEGDVQAYRVDKSIGSVWKTATALLTCVGPDEGAERVVRATARLASQLNADWHAIYIETPALQRLPAARRETILATLNLAQNLGASTAVIASPDIAESVVTYARKHNLSKVVIGRNPARPLWPWQRSSGQRLALLAPDIDLIEVGRSSAGGQGSIKPVAVAPAIAGADAAARIRRKRLRYVWAAMACGAVTLLSMPLAAHFDRSNIVAIYILAVVLVGMRFGRGPAALAAVLSVSAFDFFFVPPRFSFAVSDVQYLLTFCIMLAVGLITGQLTAGLRSQARVAFASGRARRRSVRTGTGSIGRGAARPGGQDQRRFHRAHLSCERGAAAARRGESAQAGVRAFRTFGRRYRHRAMVLRQRPARRHRHRYIARQRNSVYSIAGSGSAPRDFGFEGPPPSIAQDTGATAAAGYLRRADRHCARARALRRGGASRRGADGIGAFA